MSARWFGCADRARLREDPLPGTAPPAAGWVLIEHPGPWARDALAGSGLSPQVRMMLAAASARAGLRILLIRRPGRAAAGTAARPRRWAVVTGQPGPGAVRWGDWNSGSDLLTLTDVVPDKAPRAAAEQPVATRQPPPDPLLLVCTHGLHDTCCAVRGRPVAAALAERWPEATWECSHLGGDRFAPNLLVLPDGTHYGNLDASSGVDVVEQHLAGRVTVDHLRGVATMPPAAQAAAAVLHRRYGPWSPTAVRLERWEADGAAGPWSVTLTSPVGRRRARVVARRRPPSRLTCQAGAETSAPEYDVTWTDPPPVAPASPLAPRQPQTPSAEAR